jgi:Peptidase family M23
MLSFGPRASQAAARLPMSGLDRDQKSRLSRLGPVGLTVAVGLGLTVLVAPQASAATAGSGYLPFPGGTTVHVFQANGSDAGCSTHCTQPDYYAWDFGAASGSAAGMQIVSATSGTVIGLRSSMVGTCTDFYSSCAFGNYVFVHNDDGTYLEYLHMQTGSVAVGVGQHVAVGQQIGKVGATGYTGGFPHLHLSWLTIAKGTGNSPSVGNSLPAAFTGIGHPTTGQNVVSNNRNVDTRAVMIRNAGSGGYTVAPDGTIAAFGGAPALAPTATWPGQDIVRGAVLRSDDRGGYVVDLYGGIHPFGSAPAVTASAYWPNFDIARGIVLRSDNSSGYVLDGYGGLHPFGGAPAVTGSAYWDGWDIANAITLYDDRGGWVLDGYGALHQFGDAPAVTASAYWSGWDIARAVVAVHGLTGPSGYVLDGYGGIHPFGVAPALSVAGYHAGLDTAVGLAYRAAVGQGYEIDAKDVLTSVTRPASGCTTCS